VFDDCSTEYLRQLARKCAAEAAAVIRLDGIHDHGHVALAPTCRVGVFIAVNRFKFSMFDTADAERARAEVLAITGDGVDHAVRRVR
jgi:hypothetical protein